MIIASIADLRSIELKTNLKINCREWSRMREWLMRSLVTSVTSKRESVVLFVRCYVSQLLVFFIQLNVYNLVPNETRFHRLLRKFGSRFAIEMLAIGGNRMAFRDTSVSISQLRRWVRTGWPMEVAVLPFAVPLMPDSSLFRLLCVRHTWPAITNKTLADIVSRTPIDRLLAFVNFWYLTFKITTQTETRIVTFFTYRVSKINK